MEVRLIEWRDLSEGQLLAHAVIWTHHSGLIEETKLFTRCVDKWDDNVMTKVCTRYDYKE